MSGRVHCLPPPGLSMNTLASNRAVASTAPYPGVFALKKDHDLDKKRSNEPCSSNLIDRVLNQVATLVIDWIK
jgi:hypothetical protein